MLRQRLDALRQRRIGRIDRGARPAHRRGRIGRRIEIVAERRAQRLLVALRHRDVIDHRRPHVLGLDREQLHQRLRLGFEALHRALGVGQRAARGVELLARRGVGGLRRDRRAARPARRRSARSRQRCGERGKVGTALRGGGKAGLDVADLGFDPRDALGLIAHRCR